MNARNARSCTLRVTPLWLKGAKKALAWNSRNGLLLDQGRPGRIGCVLSNKAFIASCHIDRPDLRAATALYRVREHQHPSVGCPGRTFIVRPRRDDALSRAVRVHDADAEGSLILLCKGDEVAARTPDRGAVATGAEADAVLA